MKAIKKISQSCVRRSERSMKSDEAYMHAKNRINQDYASLCQKLSEKDIDILDEILLDFDTKMERQGMHCFESGFRTGLAAAFEALK